MTMLLPGAEVDSCEARIYTLLQVRINNVVIPLLYRERGRKERWESKKGGREKKNGFRNCGRRDNILVLNNESLLYLALYKSLPTYYLTETTKIRWVRLLPPFRDEETETQRETDMRSHPEYDGTWI